MSAESGEVRSIAWSQVFPWVMIIQGLRLATSMPVLFVATVGFLLMPVGWWGASFLLPEQQRGQLYQTTGAPSGELVVRAQELARQRGAKLGGPAGPRLSLPLEVRPYFSPMLSAAGSLVNPLWQMLHRDVNWSRLGYWTVGGIWNLFLWGLLGGTITRMAVMQYGREEREGLGAAFRFVLRRWLAYVGSPLFALAGVIGALLVSIPVGWLMYWDAGVLVAALLWFVVLLAGLFTTIFVVGLLLGWPMMWGALSAEEMGDVYEGAHRTYAYIYGRPLHYAFYALVAVVVGSAGYQVVSLLSHLVVYFGCWAVSWSGANDEFLVARGGAAGVGVAIIGALNSVVLAVAEAFRYGFLFTMAGVVYLLVRRDSDQIEFDNVHAPSQHERFGLPPLTTDESGIPGV